MLKSLVLTPLAPIAPLCATTASLLATLPLLFTATANSPRLVVMVPANWPESASKYPALCSVIVAVEFSTAAMPMPRVPAVLVAPLARTISPALVPEVVLFVVLKCRSTPTQPTLLVGLSGIVLPDAQLAVDWLMFSWMPAVSAALPFGVKGPGEPTITVLAVAVIAELPIVDPLPVKTGRNGGVPPPPIPPPVPPEKVQVVEAQETPAPVKVNAPATLLMEETPAEVPPGQGENTPVPMKQSVDSPSPCKYAAMLVIPALGREDAKDSPKAFVGSEMPVFTREMLGELTAVPATELMAVIRLNPEPAPPLNTGIPPVVIPIPPVPAVKVGGAEPAEKKKSWPVTELVVV